MLPYPSYQNPKQFQIEVDTPDEDDQHAVTPRLGEERKKKQRAGLIVENDGDRR